MNRVFWGLVSLATGIMFWAHLRDYYQFDWLFEQDWSIYFVSGVLIFAGLHLLFWGDHSNHHSSNMKDAELSEVMDDNAHLDINSSFSGSNYNLSGERFTGADIKAFFGGVRLDLRDAVIEKDCTINIKTMMGGVELFVPKDVRLDVSSSCIMGGVECPRKQFAEPGAKVLHIKAENFMGGVEVKY